MRELTVSPAAPLRFWLTERSALERETLARLWALEPATSAEELAETMLQAGSVAQVLARLAPSEREALTQVLAHGGSIPAAVLERRFGRVRKHGSYPNPRTYLIALQEAPSPTERLFLLGLIQETHMAQSRVYAVPPDLLPLMPEVAPRRARLSFSPAPCPAAALVADVALLERRMLDFLALARDERLDVIPGGGLTKASLVRLARGWGLAGDLVGVTREEHWPYAHFFRHVALGAGLIRLDADGLLRPTRGALDWLRLPRLERLRRLFEGWVESQWDELAALEGIRTRRPFARDVAAARRALLKLLAQAPAGVWLDLPAFVAEVKEVEPDYARPDGEYDRWGLTSRANLSLDGFAHWDAVEGAQIRGVVSCSLRWLGLVDVASSGSSASFCLNAYGAALLQGAPAPEEPPVEPLVVQPNFEVVAGAFASPYARFQLARIAETAPGHETTTYRLTRRSIQAARQRGIGLEEMLRFLEQHSGRPLPQNVEATLTEWAGQYGQIALRRGYVLQAEDAALLERVRRDRRVRMPRVEQLGERALLVREGDAPGLAERLRRAGYGLAEDVGRPEQPLSEHDLAVVVAALEFYAQAEELLGVHGAPSAALRRRVAELLPEQQLNRAYQVGARAAGVLRQRLTGRDEAV